MSIFTKQGRARGRLEKEIATILETVRAHEANAVPAGHVYYKTLFRDVTAVTTAFASEYDVSVTDLFAQYPALGVIQTMATGQAAPASGPRGGVGLVAALALLSPALIGVGYAVFHWVTRLLGA